MKFEDTAIKAYMIIRQHANLFINLFSMVRQLPWLSSILNYQCIALVVSAVIASFPGHSPPEEWPGSHCLRMREMGYRTTYGYCRFIIRLHIRLCIRVTKVKNEDSKLLGWY